MAFNVNATHSLRNTNTDLRLPLKGSANGQKFFSFRGGKCWNGLSTEAKQTTSIKAFLVPDVACSVYLQIITTVLNCILCYFKICN